ncbi:unnamed protein product, partial [Closterium sp. NIES-53]
EQIFPLRQLAWRKIAGDRCGPARSDLRIGGLISPSMARLGSQHPLSFSSPSLSSRLPPPTLLPRSQPLGLRVQAMVIAGADGPSPERAAAWSAVVATPHSGPEKVTTATKPPLPQAPKHVSAVSETILPPAPAAPLAAPESGPSAPVAVPSGPAAPPAPLVAAVEPSVPAHGPDPAPPALPALSAPVVAQSAPGVPAALPAAVVLPAAIPAVAQSLLAVSATTGGPAPLVAPSTAGPFVPAVAPMVVSSPS